MSAIESAAPTSWKWTFSIVVPWTLASASASRVKIRRARSFWRSVRQPAVDHRQDVVQVPMLVLRLVLDRDLGRPKAVLLHFLATQPAAGQPERADGRVEGRQIDARIDQRPEGHVAADAAGTIEIGQFGHGRSSRWCMMDTRGIVPVFRSHGYRGFHSVRRLTRRPRAAATVPPRRYPFSRRVGYARPAYDRLWCGKSAPYSDARQGRSPPMGATLKDRKSRNEPMLLAPWFSLPPQMRVLYITTRQRTGGWLAEAFAADSASEVILEEAVGTAAGLARLRDEVFDAVLVSHEPGELDALDLIEGYRAGGADEPIIVLGMQSEQEMAALCYEVGADGYVCVHTATTRNLIWIVARAVQRHQLVRENQRLALGEQARLQREHDEAERLLAAAAGDARRFGVAAARRSPRRIAAAPGRSSSRSTCPRN